MPSFGEACRSYRGSLWLLRKAGGLDDLASSGSDYTCEQLLAASRPIPARRDWRLLGATSARFVQALWGECPDEPPESTPTPHRSPSQGHAEDMVAGAQQACVPLIARRWCWPRRAWGKYEKARPGQNHKWAVQTPLLTWPRNGGRRGGPRARALPAPHAPEACTARKKRKQSCCDVGWGSRGHGPTQLHLFASACICMAGPLSLAHLSKLAP